MIKNKHTRKTIAIFFLLFSIIYEVKAQGPTSPEATAFEPIDAADMVNLGTGDFSYVLPLIEVPSPEGGYPIALSYHAGIAMDQEASWVGLGWSLNPGAINRDINGYADDWNQGKTSSIFYDAGGESKFYSIGVSVGISDYASVGSSLSYTENRTYGGETSYRFDQDFNVSLGFKNSGFGINGSIGTSGVGVGAGYSVSSKNNPYGGGLGLNFNQSFINGKGSFNASASFKISDGSAKRNALGISFSSINNIGVSIGSKGINLSGTNNNTNNVSYNNTGIAASIPITPGFNLDFAYHRSKYWLFDSQYNDCYGSLYPKDFKYGKNRALNPNKTLSDYGESLYKFDKELQLKENNLAYITKDSYKVTAQGIYGSISPKFQDINPLLINSIPGKIQFSGEEQISLRNLNDSNKDLFFSFDNSFSSYLRMKSGSWETPSPFVTKISDVTPFGGKLLSSIEINGELKSSYNNLKGRKREGNYIEVFTNAEITASNIIEVNSEGGFSRAFLKAKEGVKDGIGAYRITTIDGKIYHYSLPVYQKEKFNRNSEIGKSDEIRFREEMSFTPYATHWLLTAITGPDYVDVNGDGKLDKGDYGYWVEFDYGKWSDGFTWSTPSNKVISNTSKGNLTYFKSLKNKSYSWGVKELYYLDKIKTRTHTALFIKEDRLGSTSSEVHFNNTNYINRQIKYVQKIKGVSYLLGFESSEYNYSKYNAFDLKYAEGHYDYSVNLSAQKSLQLKEIQIVKNENIIAPISKSNSGKLGKSIGNIKIKQVNKFYNASRNKKGEEVLFDIDNNYYGQNYYYILDDKDTNTKGIAEKVIEFNYTHNQLAKNNPNSPEGKLALSSLVFKGKNGIGVLPPYKFTYNKPYLKYEYEKMDVWGYYEKKPDAWSLNKIATPIGADIKIIYESDDYDEAIAGKYETFDSNLQFVLSQYNGKLRIKVYNEVNSSNTIDFTEKFQLGSVNTNMWVCRKHDYNDWGCQSRIGRVDIQNKNLNVISISSTELVLEANLSVTSNHNEGLEYLYGSIIGLKNHPGVIREEQLAKRQCAEPPGCTNVTPRLVLEYSIIGNKIGEDKNAGGLRVKQLELTDGISHSYTNYYYNAENSDKNKNELNYKSSGVTSYSPSRFFKEIKYISELPAPLVMYNRVTVQNTDSKGKSEFETVYKFKTLNSKKIIDNEESQFTIPDLLDIKITQNNTVDGVVVGSVASDLELRKYDLVKNFSFLGKLISKEIITDKGHVIQKTENEYFNLSEINQGIEEEASVYYKGIIGEERPKYLLNSTSIINYSTPLKSVSTTQGNFNSIKYFDKHDFLTGKVLETRTYASDGKAFKTKVVPAYTKYSQMGSKVDDDTNKNMLTQEAANYSYVLKGNDWKEVGVGITTWNNVWDYQFNNRSTGATSEIWRKHKSYIWKGAKNNDGTFDSSNKFKWTLGATQNNNWQKTSETTRYNQFSNPLEVKDINNNYASSKMGDNYSKVIATANANYDEMHYSGAEYLASENSAYFDGGIKSLGYKRVVDAHTGTHVVEVNTGQSAFEINIPTRDDRTDIKQRFKVSVWVRKGQETKAKIKVKKVNGSSSSISFNTNENVQAGNWVLLSGYVTIPVEGVTISITSSGGLIQLDDFRLHPVTSSMTSYVYNKWDEVSYITGSNGLSTHYMYDAAGRLKETQVEVVTNIAAGINGGFEKVSTNSYNYKKK